MKAKLSNASQWILTAIISLLGFSACSGSLSNEQPDMYGTPTADYKAEGSVTDEEGNPIEGIKVKVELRGYYNNSSETKSVYSGGDGQFITPQYRDQEIISLTAIDIDGGNNGGEFEDKTINLQGIKPTLDKSNADGWYQGVKTYNVDIQLTKKSADNE